jgi:hypothetical protein
VERAPGDDLVVGQIRPVERHAVERGRLDVDVAGIALGSGSASGPYRGIAPEAGLIDVKVLDQNRQAFSSDINRGLEWLIARQVATHDVNVANISIVVAIILISTAFAVTILFPNLLGSGNGSGL